MMRPSILMIAVLVTACSDRPAARTVDASLPQGAGVREVTSAEESRSPKPDAAPKPAFAMPGDACTLDGYWSFFEAFVREPALRTEHSDDAGRAALGSFDIAQQDSRWVRAGDHSVALDIEERREGTRFNVEATPVELDADDEVIRSLGATRRYRFEHKDACWQFAGTQ